MAAAASGAERPLAAAHPAQGEGDEDCTSLAGGGSASTGCPPLHKAKEEVGGATRAAGLPVGGLSARGQPSPPPKKTSTTGRAGEKFEADNKEEDELKRRQIQEEKEKGAASQKTADTEESEQDQTRSGKDGPAGQGGQGLPADKFVNLGNGAVNVGFSAADVGAFFYLICDMDDAEAAHIVATLEENNGLKNSSCGKTIAAFAANIRLDSQWPGLGEYETDDPIYLWCQALVGVCASLKKNKHISWLTHVDRAWGRQFAQRAIRGFHDWEYNFPFGAEIAEVPEEQFEALARVKGGMAALVCDINFDNELIFTLSSNKEDPLQVFRTLDKIADIVDWWIPRGIGGNTVVICPTYLMLTIRTMAAWCSQRRRAEITKGTTPSRQLLHLPTSCALLGNLSHLLHGNGKWNTSKAEGQYYTPGGQHPPQAEGKDHEFYSKKYEYDYKDKWTTKNEYGDQSDHARKTYTYFPYVPRPPLGQAAYHKHKAYEQDWEKTEYSPEYNKEEKYDEKIGKKLCWFFNKGQCKKGKHCNFAHEQQHGRPAVKEEAPRSWGQSWPEEPKAKHKDSEREKQWKNEYEEPEYLHTAGLRIFTANMGGYYNTSSNNKYQQQVSGTPSDSRQLYSFSPASRKHAQQQW